MFAHASVCIRMESIERLMAYCLYTIDYLHAIFPLPAQILKSNEAYGEKKEGKPSRIILSYLDSNREGSL